MEDRLQLMKETVGSIGEYLEKFINGINAVCVNIQKGREDKGLAICVDIIDGLKWLMDAIYLCKPLEEKYDIIINTDQTLEIFPNIIEAFENSDYVLLGDILEYELLPIAQQWKQDTMELLSKISDADE